MDIKDYYFSSMTNVKFKI